MNTLKIHRSLLESMKKDLESKEQEDRFKRTAFVVLTNELMDYRNSFHLVIRFFIHRLVDAETRFRGRLLHDSGREARQAGKNDEAGSVQAQSPEHAYLTALDQFTDAVERAIKTSRTCAGFQVGARRHWTSILYTKLCTTAVSLLWLCPLSEVHRTGLYWDFSSVSSLVRSLLRYSLIFFYIGIEDVSEEEWLARRDVMYMHDALTRLRLFVALNDQTEIQAFRDAERELRSRLDSNGFFKALPEPLRAEVFNGERWSILSQEEILRRMNELDRMSQAYYHFLSCHAASLPSSFCRMSIDHSGAGVENETERAQMAAGLEFTTGVLKRSTDDMQQVFSGLAKFNTGDDWNALKGVSEWREF